MRKLVYTVILVVSVFIAALVVNKSITVTKEILSKSDSAKCDSVVVVVVDSLIIKKIKQNGQ